MLDINKLTYSYPDGKRVLDCVDIQLQKGEKTALIGPNGSGKTTLFLLCCGILKSNEGKINLNDQKIEHKKFNPHISYLFQTADDQLFSPTVFDDIAFGPLNMGLDKETILKRVEESLERVDFQESPQKAPFHLSGGEKRMAAIATLLSMNPQILLFDEPTANLDSRNRRRVITLIDSMDETLFISSHDLEFLLETCDRVILLDDGKIIADGPIREILSNEKLMNDHGMEKPHSLVPHKINHHSHH